MSGSVSADEVDRDLIAGVPVGYTDTATIEAKAGAIYVAITAPDGTLAASGYAASRDVLVATDQGRALYETLGWRVHAPYASAVIPDPGS